MKCAVNTTLAMMAFIIGAAILITMKAFALELPDVPGSEVDLAKDLIAAITLGKAGLLAGLLAGVQLLIMLAKKYTLLDKLSGNAKFVVIVVLSMSLLILGQMVAGVKLTEALMHSSVLTALGNFAYAAYERFVEKK